MKNISRLRKLKGWTQVDLAHECGVNQATISKAEKGDGGVSLKTYQIIAEALEVQLHEIFMPETAVDEMKLLAVFRSLPSERQQGWLDLLGGPLEDLQKSDQ